MEKKKMAQMLGTDDPDCPPGHVRLPDDKRKETLQLIKNSMFSLIHYFISYSLKPFVESWSYEVGNDPQKRTGEKGIPFFQIDFLD